MTPNEYQIKARETAIYPNLGNNLPYVVLGLCGEVSEVFEAYNIYEAHVNGNVSEETINELTKNLKSEFSDGAWYLSNICSELKINFEDVAIVEDMPHRFLNYAEALVVHAGRIAEYTKKIMRDDKGEINETKKNKIIDELKMCYTCIYKLCEELTCTIEEIMIQNIEKLQSRKERGVLTGEGSNR